MLNKNSIDISNTNLLQFKFRVRPNREKEIAANRSICIHKRLLTSTALRKASFNGSKVFLDHSVKALLIAQDPFL